MRVKYTVASRSRVFALAGMAASLACSLPVAAQSDIARGQRLLAQYQCGACHAIPGVEDARGDAGPPLEKFGRRVYIAGHVPNTADRLMQWILEPRALVPNTTMPDMGVSRDDARDIAAYLHSLR